MNNLPLQRLKWYDETRPYVYLSTSITMCDFLQEALFDSINTNIKHDGQKMVNGQLREISTTQTVLIVNSPGMS